MKTILITGAGTGLGSELAKAYGEVGNRIILVGRKMESLKNTALQVTSGGADAQCMVCDISNYGDVEKLVQDVIRRYSNIDYLINNAGIGYFGPLADTTLDEINKMIDINVKGTIYVTQSFLHHTRERILNIISTAGLRGKVNESIYVASKFAVRGFTESLQKELEGKELKVTAVYMGGMDTPFWNQSTHIKDKSRLKSPSLVAAEIKRQDDGRAEILIDK